jgi:hypothetical protein
MRSYKVIAGSAAEQFHNSRAKIRMYGGGFGNGKTTALVADALRVACDYPGAVMLLGRATFPKLNSTLRREFFKWCPPAWIKQFNKGDNTCTLHNGTTIDFRYLDQRTSGDSEQTSNLLSANYDYIGVDQIDDPEITEHDFEQMLGRLRGAAEYVGSDSTMPRTGPRMMVLTCNPTLGWPYRRIVRPYHNWLAGKIDYDLISIVGADGLPVLDHTGRQQPLVSVHEATTYDNSQNLAPDFIQTLEATYRGKMRDRYLLGKWVAFEGVVYDDFDETVHVVPYQYMMDHLRSVRADGYELIPIEGYDFGITEPSCYMIGVTDTEGTVYLLDGFYEKEMSIGDQVKLIREKRALYAAPHMRDEELRIWADPAVTVRTAQHMSAGVSVMEMFRREGIWMSLANNAIMSGIMRVKERLYVQQHKLNPFTSAYGCPALFVADSMQFLRNEFAVYRWKRGVHNDTPTDKPVDVNNHAMDTLRYMLSADAPRPVRVRAKPRDLNSKLRKWHEADTAVSSDRRHRYT